MECQIVNNLLAIQSWLELFCLQQISLAQGFCSVKNSEHHAMSIIKKRLLCSSYRPTGSTSTCCISRGEYFTLSLIPEVLEFSGKGIVSANWRLCLTKRKKDWIWLTQAGGMNSPLERDFVAWGVLVCNAGPYLKSMTKSLTTHGSMVRSWEHQHWSKIHSTSEGKERIWQLGRETGRWLLPALRRF